MIKSKNTNLILITSFILSLLLITIGLSFAYFTANITGTENTTTIEASGGVMNINYQGGENINASNISPSDVAFATKHFTLTGKSTTNDNMNYHIILVIEENTFTNNALQYKLASTNTDNNGTAAPSIIQSGIANGAHEIYLGDGTFESPVNNKDHSYTLELFFPETGKSQNDDMNKTFKAYINIREGQYNFPGYNHEKGVNHPVLFTGMTPVKWDGTTEIETTEDDSDWYNYDEKRWANAKSADGSYWVWIPRYAYKIETCYHTSAEDCLALTGKEAGDIDVKFLKGTSKISSDNLIVETSGYEPGVKDTSLHHFLHPTFQFNGEELGFWMAKFEPSVADQESSCYLEVSIDNCNNADNIIKIIPNATSLRYVDIYNSFLLSNELKLLQHIFGWTTDELDTHIITNHEWGAVAYLSKSKYGAQEEVWINANNEYKTGCSAPTVNSSSVAYCIEYHTENGQKASTTHNIYGVYDMSGGAWERIMGNFNYLVGSSGFNEENIFDIKNKYITKYTTLKEKKLSDIGMLYDLSVYGDAVYETSFNAAVFDGNEYIGLTSSSWYSDYSYLPYFTAPWFARGGRFTYRDSAGLFHFTHTSGAAAYGYTFRPVLMPLK